MINYLLFGLGPALIILKIYQFILDFIDAWKLKKQLPELLKKTREDAIKSSRNVIRGQLTEQLLTISFPEFPYCGSDLKMLYQPVDAIVFDGMSEIRDTGKGEITIVVSDIKTGNAQLSPVEKAIKDAILNNRVRFEEWVVKDGVLKIKKYDNHTETPNNNEAN